MQTGMADFAHKAATTGSIYLERVQDYDLYCHYVAGLVGEGLSRLLSASGKEQPWLKDQLELSNSAGLMLQKTNIIRDYREDVDQSRFFWPREIWGAQANGGFAEMRDMRTPRLGPRGEDKRLWVLSGMVLDVLRHAPDSLDYLRVLKNQTVFNFCAIPQTMAMATLELVFMNPAVFDRNIKIRKAEAAKVRFRLPSSQSNVANGEHSLLWGRPIRARFHTCSGTTRARSMRRHPLSTPTTSGYPLLAARYVSPHISPPLPSLTMPS